MDTPKVDKAKTEGWGQRGQLLAGLARPSGCGALLTCSGRALLRRLWPSEAVRVVWSDPRRHTGTGLCLAPGSLLSDPSPTQWGQRLRSRMRAATADNWYVEKSCVNQLVSKGESRLGK